MKTRSADYIGSPSLPTTPARLSEAAAYVRQRERLAVLPPHIKAYVRVAWGRAPRPRSPAQLSELIGHACASLGACSSDFPPLDGETRIKLDAQLNDMARQGDAASNCQRRYSPGVRTWLGATAARLDTSAAPAHAANRLSALWRALGACSVFTGTPERRFGRFAVGGEQMRFAIYYLRPGSAEPSDVTWNADVTSRVLVVSLAGEEPSLHQAGGDA